MKTIEECVVDAMDGSDIELFPFLPYILQDFWEIGTNPETIIKLILKYRKDNRSLNVLDLGCGKGAVLVRISKKLGYNCYGIDAIPEFISYAIKKAEEYKVRKLCRFEVGDLREFIKKTSNYDIIILGSIGQVLGSYKEMLEKLSFCLNTNKLILIDDAYLDDGSPFSIPGLLRKYELIKQIDDAKMKIVEEIISDKLDSINKQFDLELKSIERRCLELKRKYPEKSNLFDKYVNQQKNEYEKLKSKIICSTMVISRR